MLQADPRVLVSSPSRVPTTPETPSNSSTATTGKEEPLRSAKTDMQIPAAGSKAAKVVLAEGLVQEVVTEVVATVLEEDSAEEEEASVAEVAMVEDLVEVEADSRLVVVEGSLVNKAEVTEVYPKRPQLLTLSPTLLRAVASVVK